MDLGALLKGKTVLVTGASSGLGAHFAMTFARCGANVGIVARRRAKLEALDAGLRDAGAPAVAIAEMDVTDPASVAAAFVAVTDTLGPLDIVINNAGMTTHGEALDVGIDEFDRVIATNLRGVWLVATEAARRWKADKRPGALVNIGSILGQRVAGHLAPYIASKAAVGHLTRALALEWARYGIRVNAVAPGYFATEINDGFFHSPAGEVMLKRVPMRRIGRPEELDGAVLLLSSDAGSFMTGEIISVDGGHLSSTL